MVNVDYLITHCTHCWLPIPLITPISLKDHTHFLNLYFIIPYTHHIHVSFHLQSCSWPAHLDYYSCPMRKATSITPPPFHTRLSHTRGHLSLTIFPFLPSTKALILGEDGLQEAWRFLPHKPLWRRPPWESEEKGLEGGYQEGCWWS